MASQGLDNAGLGTSAGHVNQEETDGSGYQLLDGSRDVQRGALQALGVSQPLSQGRFVQEVTKDYMDSLRNC